MHTADEWALTSTWGLDEVRLALDKDYNILETYEM